MRANCLVRLIVKPEAVKSNRLLLNTTCILVPRPVKPFQDVRNEILSVRMDVRHWPLSLPTFSSATDKCDVCECPAPIPNICQDLHSSDGAGALYSALRSLRRQGRPGKSLTAGQKGEKNRTGWWWWLSACLPWWLAHTHTHTHSRSKTISSGRNVGGVYLSRRSPPDWRANLYGLCKQDFASSASGPNMAKYAWRERHMAHTTTSFLFLSALFF